jgi:serine protease Do
VIGINTWIIRANNLGFAVPINVARDVAEQVLTTGRVRRAIMGIQPASVTPEIAARLNLPVRQGAAVAEVTPGSPADRAGIRAEDIITRIDGQAVTSGGDLRRILRRKSAGETVSVTLRRGGRTETVAVRLVEAPVE